MTGGRGGKDEEEQEQKFFLAREQAFCPYFVFFLLHALYSAILTLKSDTEYHGKSAVSGFKLDSEPRFWIRN